MRIIRISPRLPVAATALTAFSILGAPAAAGPPELSTEYVLILEVSVLDVGPETTSALGARSLEIRDGNREDLELTLAWPAPDVTSRLGLRVTGFVDPDGERHRLSLEAHLMPADGEPVRSARDVEVRDGGTLLFDIVEREDRRLVLAFRVEADTRPVLAGTVRTGVPVLFRLGVERVEGERFTPLETNVLRTFVGSGVEYSFRRGEGEKAESVRLVLRPVKLRGDLAEIEVEVTGSLPGPPRPLALSRRDRLYSTRGSTSRLVVATGDPAAGYRFLITPDF